ncbi:MAG: hypothetical protein ACXVA6_22850, partial [Isosphaeraceae bacterium]
VEADPGGTVVAGYAQLLPRLVERLTEFQIPPVSLPLKAVIANGDGKYALTGRGQVSGVPQFESHRPGRFVGTASPDNAASTLDGFFLGEEPFGRCPDGMLWDCALIVAAGHGLQGDVLRSLNDSLAIGLALRVGLLVERSQLPSVDTDTGLEQVSRRGSSLSGSDVSTRADGSPDPAANSPTRAGARASSMTSRRNPA